MDRIKNIFKFKQPWIYLLIAVVAVIVVWIIGLAADQKEDKTTDIPRNQNMEVKNNDYNKSEDMSEESSESVNTGEDGDEITAPNNTEEPVEPISPEEFVNMEAENETETSDITEEPFEDATTEGQSIKIYQNGDVERLGYITAFSLVDGTMSLQFDYLEWVTGENGENGFWIENPVKEEKVYIVDEAAEYQVTGIYLPPEYSSVSFPYAGEEGSSHKLISKEIFAEYLDCIHELDAVNGNERSIPFWIRERDGVVQRIMEQYVP